MALVILVSLKIMETNTVVPEWDCNPFWSESIVFNESCIASIVAAYVDADAWCKRNLNLFKFSSPPRNDQLLNLGLSIVDGVQLVCHKRQVKLFLSSSSTFHFCSVQISFISSLMLSEHFTTMKVQSVGVAPEVNLRITQARKHAKRDPPWL